MNRFHRLIVVLLGLCRYVCAAGWTLDNSCNGAVAEKVRDAMNVAFSMAGDAFTELNKDPIDPEVLKVFRYVFSDVPFRRTTVKQVYESISGMRNEVPKNIHDPSTVIVYCDFSRVGPGKVTGKLWDADVLKDLEYTGDDKTAIDTCRDSNPVAKTFYTAAYVEPHDDAEARDTPSQLQICPWFLEHAFREQFDKKEFRLKHLAFKVYDALLKPWVDREVDYLVTFSTRMLHELSHTKEAASIGLGGEVVRDTLDYGWKKITKDLTYAHTNADNYAYFGLIIRAMKNTDSPWTVSQDGKLLQMESALQKRFARLMKWFA